MPRFARLVLLALSLALAAPACDDPCEALEQKVCNPKTPSLKRKYRNHCKIIQEKERRENLPKASCESILEHITKR